MRGQPGVCDTAKNALRAPRAGCVFTELCEDWPVSVPKVQGDRPQVPGWRETRQAHRGAPRSKMHPLCIARVALLVPQLWKPAFSLPERGSSGRCTGVLKTLMTLSLGEAGSLRTADCVREEKLACFPVPRLRGRGMHVALGESQPGFVAPLAGWLATPPPPQQGFSSPWFGQSLMVTPVQGSVCPLYRVGGWKRM